MLLANLQDLLKRSNRLVNGRAGFPYPARRQHFLVIWHVAMTLDIETKRYECVENLADFRAGLFARGRVQLLLPIAAT